MNGSPGMNSGLPQGAVPLLGQQQAQAAAVAHQIFLGMYIPLIPQLAVYRAAHGYAVEGGLTEDATPDRVAEEAAEYVEAAMKRLGFNKAE